MIGPYFGAQIWIIELSGINVPTQGRYLFKGIIEGDQIQVTAFSLEYFSYLTGLTRGQWERKPNSVVRF